MIAFITLCYSAIVWLIFFKLKLLPWNRSSQIAVFGIGVTGILGLLISMNLFQPYSTDVRVYERVVQIVPRVTGRVIDVPVKANTRVVKGDLLFRIDPRPFQYEVDRLTADVDLKKIVYEDATALAGALVAAEIKRDRAQAEFHAASAQLASARLDLAEATVYSPIDGWVTNLALAPGQIASQMASLPIMTVVGDQGQVIIATFAQPALAFVQLGDAVEVAFDRLPGQTLDGRVQAIIPATGQGQLPPSGALMEWTTQPVPGRFGVRLELDEVHDDLVIPAGASGVAAVYSQHAQVIQIIRRVIIRMTSWLNYVIL